MPDDQFGPSRATPSPIKAIKPPSGEGARSVSDPLRLEAVYRTGLLDESPPDEFERLLRLAVRCLDASAAAFLLVSGDGFHCRGSIGLPGAWQDNRPWPLSWPFLVEAAFEGPVAVGGSDPDTARIAGIPGSVFRAFAGHAVQDPDGNTVGVLALWNAGERAWNPGEAGLLEEFAGALEDAVARRLEVRRKEEEVRASLERTRMAVEGGCDLMYEWDLATGALRVTGPFDRLLGHGEGGVPLNHEAWGRILHPEDRERVEARIRRHLEQGETFFEEYRVVCKDGSVRHWSDRGKAFRNAKGRATLWVGLVNDVTGRKLAEKVSLGAREERDLILETMDAPVLARELSGRIVFANKAAARYLGFASPEELLSAPRSALDERFAVADEEGRPVDPEDFPGMASLRGIAEMGAVRRFQGRKDGRTFWCAVDSTPVADVQGRVRLSITSLHDISALKQAQLELHRSRDEMDAILRSINYGVIAMDGAGGLLYVNPAAARQLGSSTVEELKAHSREDLLSRFEILDQEGSPVPYERLPANRALRGERAEEELICYRSKATGEVKWSYIQAVPMMDGEGRVRMVILMMQDVTALQRARNELARSRDELEVILRTMNSACTAQDPLGNLVFANRAAAALLGFDSPEELMRTGGAAAMDRYELLDEAGRPFPLERLPGRRALQGAAVTGQVIGYRVKATGREHWSVVNGTPVFDSNGNVRLAINVFHDITSLKRADEALRRSENKLNLIFNTVSDMVVLVAADSGGGFRMIMANTAYLSRSRFPAGEILDRRLDEVMPGEHGRQLIDLLARTAGSGQAQTVEFLSPTLHGKVVVEARMTPIPGEDGRCTHILVVGKDVTDRKEAERAQRRHLRFLESADAVSRVAETAMDAEKVLPAALEKVLEVMDCDHALLIHPADPDAQDFRIPFAASREESRTPEPGQRGESALRDIVRAAAAQEGPVSLGPGGSPPEPASWSDESGAASLLAMPVRPRAGKPWLLCLVRSKDAQPWSEDEVSIFRDIGSRITAALGSMLLYKDLRRSEEKYRTLFERSLDGVFRCAPDGTVLDANPALVTLLGCSDRSDLIGDVQRQLLPAGGDFVGLQSRRDPFTVELRRKDGGKVWAEVSAQAIRRSDGGVACFEGMVRDIDDRKRTEEALKENEEVLRQAQKMEAVGRLAGGVAHDFNNLLTAINGFGDLLLLQVPKDDPRRMHVEEIRKAGERAASLTGQLLAFSRKQVLAPRHLDLNSVATGMDPMLRRLIGENIDFATVLESDLPRVVADPTQVEQIILNLALNARDAMPTGGKLRISTGLRRLDGGRGRYLPDVRDGDYVMLTVSDTGTGMDEETKARLFEPFFTTKGKDKGTGLGLSMVYGAVKQGGGTIEVETRPGKGTTFRVLLPAAGKGEAEPARGRPTGKMPASGKGTETILLVEDEDAVRRLVRDVLRFNGYKVLEAPGGEQALEAAAGHDGTIHLLLTDVVMGGMSGRELAERLRILRPDTKVLYMSGYTEDAIIRHGVLAAQTAFIGKPFAPAALAAKVREVLAGQAEKAA